MEPNLSRPIFASVLAALFYVFTIPPWPPALEGIRILFGLLAIIAGGAMVLTLVEYIYAKVVYYVEETTIAWSAAQVRFAEAVSRMTPKQIEILEQGGVLRIRPGPLEGRLHWFIQTPLIDIPLWWVHEFMDLCETSFPHIPPQHGLPDNTERKYRQAFTKLMCDPTWNIASWENGNGAEWLLPNMAAVRDALGVG